MIKHLNSFTRGHYTTAVSKCLVKMFHLFNDYYLMWKLGGWSNTPEMNSVN